MRSAVIYNFLIEANIIAGIAILLMIPVRKFFRKSLGNRVLCFAWLLVAVRLLCPLSLPNPLINEIVTPYNDQPEAVRPIAGQVRVRVHDALSDMSWQIIQTTEEQEGLTFNEAREKPAYQALVRLSNGIGNGFTARLGMAVYAAGAFAVAGWFVFVNVRFRRKLKKNRMEALDGEMWTYYESLCEKYKVKPLPVYFVDPLSSACLVGSFKPYIALPLAAGEEQARQMLAHEVCHYKAKDNIWTLVALVCCVIHWFNPLVWAAAAMSRLDRELKCDDGVTRDMDEDARREYAGTLIQSVSRRALPGMPVLATGMSVTGRKMKARVGGILWGGKRIKAFAMAFAITASLLLVCAFGTAAYGEVPSPWKNDPEYERRDYAYYDTLQTLEEALASENAVKTKEDALKIAKELFGGAEYQVDVENDVVEWTVQDDAVGIMGKANYYIAGTVRNGGALNMYLAVDGSGAWLITNASDPYITKEYPAYHEYVKETTLTEEELEAVKRFCIDFTEKAEPGETQYFKELHFNGFMTVDGVTYAQLEAPYNEESGKTFVVEVKPELRMIEYYTGNG